jgi:branched-chain amino acid transport system permease protein
LLSGEQVSLNLNTIISILFDGLAYAMFLFIVSVGLSVTMGLMGFVNLAHGAFAMAGGYLVLTLTRSWGVPFLPSLVIVFLVVGAVSVIFERTLYARLYRATELDQVLLTIGLAFMAIAGFTYFYGPSPQSIRLPSYLTGQIEGGFRSFPTYRVFIIAVGVVLIAALWYVFERTNIGAKIRAAVDNRRMAQSIGIDVDRLFTLTFGIGSGLAALGGGRRARQLQGHARCRADPRYLRYRRQISLRRRRWFLHLRDRDGDPADPAGGALWP